MCYIRDMAQVASRELRNDTKGVLLRAEAGEDVVITVDGRPVASLIPFDGKDRWMKRERFLDLIGGATADPALADELREILTETTDDIG